jgi:hypothetical protein
MMDKVQKHNSLNTNTPSSESYKNDFISSTPEKKRRSDKKKHVDTFCKAPISNRCKLEKFVLKLPVLKQDFHFCMKV